MTKQSNISDVIQNSLHHAHDGDGCILQETAVWTTQFDEAWRIDFKKSTWTVTSVALLMQGYRTPVVSGNLWHVTLVVSGNLWHVTLVKATPIHTVLRGKNYLAGKHWIPGLDRESRATIDLSIHCTNPTAKYNADSVVQIPDLPPLPLWNNFAVWLTLLSSGTHRET